MVEVSLFRTLRWLGLPFVQVGKPRWIYHTTNIAIHAQAKDLLPGVRRADLRRDVQVSSLLVRCAGMGL